MKVQKTKEKEQFLNEETKIKKKYKKDLLICLAYAIIIIVYFICMNKLVNQEYIKYFYIAFVLISIVLFEIAYKKESRELAISGIECTLLALHTLLLERNIILFKETKEHFILSTSYIWPVYYCLKAIIIYTKENKRKLKQISDIREIVKEEKPTKKVAKKRKT